MTTPSQKRCPHCGQVKPAAEFGINVAAPDGLYRYCRQCRREYYYMRTGRRPLDRFSTQELKDELKRRGGQPQEKPQ